MKINALLMDITDNVVTTIAEIRAGETIIYRKGEEYCELTAAMDIPFCHKAALSDIPKGANVIKYGESLGEVSKDIKAGEWVNETNLFSVPRDYDSELADENFVMCAKQSEGNPQRKELKFWGYRRALRDAGIEYSDRNFLLIKTNTGEGWENAEELCAKMHYFTAFFCCSDLYAVVMMSELRDRGFRIPEDISVVGFDDNLFSRICTPKLTTVHQDAGEKGRIAAKTLIGLIRGIKPEEREIRLETRLETRNTVRKIDS